jgi:hypothetical protein
MGIFSHGRLPYRVIQQEYGVRTQLPRLFTLLVLALDRAPPAHRRRPTTLVHLPTGVPATPPVENRVISRIL